MFFLNDVLHIKLASEPQFCPKQKIHYMTKVTKTRKWNKKNFSNFALLWLCSVCVCSKPLGTKNPFVKSKNVNFLRYMLRSVMRSKYVWKYRTSKKGKNIWFIQNFLAWFFWLYTITMCSNRSNQNFAQKYFRQHFLVALKWVANLLVTFQSFSRKRFFT